MEKRKKFIINFLFFSILAGLLYFTLNYLVGWLMPFIIGFIIAYLMNPMINWIVSKTKISRKFLAYFFTIILAALLGLLIWLVVYLLINLAKEYFFMLPDLFVDQMQPSLIKVTSWFNSFIGDFPPAIKLEWASLQVRLLAEFQNLAVNLSGRGIVILTNITKAVPSFLVAFVFTILATIFSNTDFPEIKAFIFKLMPKKYGILAKNIKIAFVETVGKYLTAYLKIMTITFVELSIGFIIIDITNPLLVAFLIAVFDILPVLGTGGIMVPWIAFSMISGDFQMAGFLAVIYLFVTVVRQFIEPKIVGDQLGLNPLVTIISIYLGFVWFGVAGMLVIPIITNIFINLYKQGKLKSFINFEELYKEDFEPEEHEEQES